MARGKAPKTADLARAVDSISVSVPDEFALAKRRTAKHADR